MSCTDCQTANPEPFEAGEGEGAVQAYWFLVCEEKPVEAIGVEADGELAFRFRVCDTLEHPIPADGEEVLCADCFDKRYPLEGESTKDESWRDDE
jgi:hypothetical protein